MRDIDVRSALTAKVLKKYVGAADTLILHELGLRHGRSRVDVAVINGVLHGYEIKSERDTLDRLPAQVQTYGLVLDRATLVVAERHFKKALPLLPDWWGIRTAATNKRGDIIFSSARPSLKNPEISPLAVAELLWRDEVVTILTSVGVTGKILKQPRSNLYSALVEAVPLKQLQNLVRETLRTRENWRGHSVPA